MLYQIVWLDERGGLAEAFTDDVIAYQHVRGVEPTGEHRSHRTRAELQGHPTFRTLAGPMWGGPTRDGSSYMIRYESSAAYARLSV